MKPSLGIEILFKEKEIKYVECLIAYYGYGWSNLQRPWMGIFFSLSISLWTHTPHAAHQCLLIQ